MEKVLLDESLDDLRRSLAGTVVGPADAEYDTLRRCFNALVDRRPAVIARCIGAGDVVVAFDFARAHALPVAVRGGGHNPAGHCVCDDGLVIDLSLMRRVEVHGEARIARADGGATWLDFDQATQAFGLVTPGGVVGSTGVVGLSLGGGLRGGGGNFGVVTRLEFRLHPLERVVGGLLRYSGAGVRAALRRFRDLAARSPRDLSCQAGLSVDGSLAPALVVAPCYTGSDAEPQELRALRSAPGLVDDGVRVHTFLDQQRVFDSPYGENRHYWKGHFVRELPDELLDELLERIVALGRPPGGILIESLHGAPKDADAPSGALGFRHAAFNISVMATWQDPGLDAEQIDWARQTAAAVEPWSVSGGYVNYMQADEPIERVRAAFGAEAFERLQALKRQYDPNNVLRRNQNIPPL